MTKKEKKPVEPVSLGVYQQMVFDRAADLMAMADNADVKAVIERLLDMSDYPIKAPTVKVIIEDGIVQDVMSDASVDLEVVDVDSDCEDADKLREYRDQIYKDRNLKSIEFDFADFKD